MKFQKLGLAIAAMVGCASANAFDGTVNVTGKIRDKTCSVKTSSKNLTVTLPNVSAQALNAAGKTAATTPFAIQLEDCVRNISAAPDLIWTYFEPSANIENDRLKNTATTNPAQNVQIQLLNSSKRLVKLSESTGLLQDSTRQIHHQKDYDLGYYAQYYATDTATPGAVSASVNYTMVYH